LLNSQTGFQTKNRRAFKSKKGIYPISDLPERLSRSGLNQKVDAFRTTIGNSCKSFVVWTVYEDFYFFRFNGRRFLFENFVEWIKGYFCGFVKIFRPSREVILKNILSLPIKRK